MDDPYEILGLERRAGEEEVRGRYLELVRAHSPERDPERFNEIRAAYEQIRNPQERMSNLLFHSTQEVSIDEVIDAALQELRGVRVTADVLRRMTAAIGDGRRA